MTLIVENEVLTSFCNSLSKTDFITVDTEFLRDKTYWPKLCLIQIGGPDQQAAIDVLAEGLDLTPVLALMRKPDLLKVFHAARQDFEIFYRLMGELPFPVIDTQISAMVCGFGDSVGYETLVSQLIKKKIDKSRILQIISKLESLSELKYNQGDFKGSIRAIRRAERYF